jgi:putative nucleotidyltransferase with HDIG domain
MRANASATGVVPGPVRPARYVGQVLIATTLVAVLPVLAVWWLRASGTLTSALPGMAIGVGLSLGCAQLGRLSWQTRPGSQHLLFSELMVWGYLHRLHSERRLASARALLGSMSDAQRGVEGGISAEHQAKLLEQLASAMDARDPNTHGHSRRVARYAWRVATRMGLPREEVARIRTAGAIHDIGKIKTPRSILSKQGPLTDAEYEIIKRHAGDGADMTRVLHDERLTAIVRHHHERLDGSGYPDRLAGEAIPLGARILSVADTFDSITANRPYRPARPHKEALDILRRESGSQLDPAVVRAFCAYYSGRRPLALWASLTSLPQRAIAQMGSSVAGVAAAAKVVVVSALVGGLAVGTASLSRPVRAHATSTVRLSRSISAADAIRPFLAGAAAPAGTGARALAAPGVSRQAHAVRPRVLASTRPGGSPAAPAGGGSAPAGAGEGPAGSAPGTAKNGGGSSSGGSSGGGKAKGEGGGPEGSGKGKGEGGGSEGSGKGKGKGEGEGSEGKGKGKGNGGGSEGTGKAEGVGSSEGAGKGKGKPEGTGAEGSGKGSSEGHEPESKGKPEGAGKDDGEGNGKGKPEVKGESSAAGEAEAEGKGKGKGKD